SHPEVVKAGKEALEKYGAGLSSVRFICGTQDIHKELEDNISKFHGRDDTILYASCFDANAGIFEILLGKEDAVFSDELNHASIIDGIRLCKAQKFRYLHKDMKDLESKLQSSNARIKLIATDGVFSMDGNVTPLPEICDLADKYQALVFVDECHATGFFGKTGRGTEEFFGLNNRVDIINSTLGKALGGAAGGYTTGPKELINLLRQRSRPYLFSNSVPPPVVGCANKVSLTCYFFVVFDFTYGVFRIRRKSSIQYRTFSNPNDKCRLATDMANEMLDRGIYVVGFSYPVVPKGKARIRVQISASHSFEDIDETVEAFKQIGKKFKVID
ncbi:2-amino-3-ketobutyrate coenzyme A ligase, mitochondrial, partial [Armadillidium nasatum]